MALTELAPHSRVFLPGAGTSSLIDYLVSLRCHVIANDISAIALNKLAIRLEDKPVEYLHHDISLPLQRHLSVDVWYDRAVLHFLLTEQAITHYFDNLKRAVKEGGYVIFAEFSLSGASQCAGLPVHQYSIEQFTMRLGESFELITHEPFVFINPHQHEKPYIYALFKRVSK